MISVHLFVLELEAVCCHPILVRAGIDQERDVELLPWRSAVPAQRSNWGRPGALDARDALG
jgi:hypothetical protein